MCPPGCGLVGQLLLGVDHALCQRRRGRHRRCGVRRRAAADVLTKALVVQRPAGVSVWARRAAQQGLSHLQGRIHPGQIALQLARRAGEQQGQPRCVEGLLGAGEQADDLRQVGLGCADAQAVDQVVVVGRQPVGQLVFFVHRELARSQVLEQQVHIERQAVRAPDHLLDKNVAHPVGPVFIALEQGVAGVAHALEEHGADVRGVHHRQAVGEQRLAAGAAEGGVQAALWATGQQPHRPRQRELAQQVGYARVAADDLVEPIGEHPECGRWSLGVLRLERRDGPEPSGHVVFERLAVLRLGARRRGGGGQGLPGAQRRLQQPQERAAAVAGVAAAEPVVKQPPVPRLGVGRGQRGHEHGLADPGAASNPAEACGRLVAGRAALEPALGHGQLVGATHQVFGHHPRLAQEIIPREHTIGGSPLGGGGCGVELK